MQEMIKPYDESNEFFIDEGCFITELSNSANDPGVSIARARVEPGVTTRWHRLIDTTERYYIVKGQGVMQVGELPQTPVHTGDVVLIPPMCRQRITNTGAEDLILLAICSPRFSPAVYQDIDQAPIK